MVPESTYTCALEFGGCSLEQLSGAVLIKMPLAAHVFSIPHFKLAAGACSNC